MKKRGSRFENKVSVVTGGGSGFGKSIAESLAANGAKVVVADVNLDNATAVATAIQEAGYSAVAALVDVADGPSMERLALTIEEKYHGLDIVINNAGVSQRFSEAGEVSEAEFDRLITVNLKSIYWSAVHLVPLLKKRGGGVIINTASAAAIRTRKGNAWYAASKAAVTSATQSLALDLASSNIRVCATCPVISYTPLLASAMQTFGDATSQELKLQEMIQGIPLGRMCAPEDISNAVMFLASNEASFLTGVVLPVDGGRCI